MMSMCQMVEEELKKALIKTRLIENWENCGWNRSGRTDKGVSAFKQIASLIVRSTGGHENALCATDGSGDITAAEKQELPYIKMLNGTLPKSIRVLAWAPVPEDFSARHQCTQRTYTYLFPKGNFDIQACDLLVGEHDFRNFCRIDMNKERVEMSYVRTINYARISAISDDISSPYDFFELTIKAKGFLWHQIRCIMALLCEIGCQNEQPQVI
ncbi:unnamed protein product [Gongylonema pulchrum]|uniref:tRNA pseudouridine synthase n=1 Tax=Gongylonema pulchrum TaxID=637853 RepID=A0A183DSW1_9BILA|nr:unnamed protein product [Gongylonema pulchrum]